MNTLTEWLKIIDFAIENNLSHVKFISLPSISELLFFMDSKERITMIEAENSHKLRKKSMESLKNLIKKPIRVDYYT